MTRITRISLMKMKPNISIYRYAYQGAKKMQLCIYKNQLITLN